MFTVSVSRSLERTLKSSPHSQQAPRSIAPWWGKGNTGNYGANPLAWSCLLICRTQRFARWGLITPRRNWPRLLAWAAIMVAWSSRDVTLTSYALGEFWAMPQPPSLKPAEGARPPDGLKVGIVSTSRVNIELGVGMGFTTNSWMVRSIIGWREEGPTFFCQGVPH